MPLDVCEVRLRLLARYGSCDKDDIPTMVLKFLEECRDCDWDDIPIIISNYLEREVCNNPNVVSCDETDDDGEENEVYYHHHEVSHFVLQDSSMFEPNVIENSDFEDDENIIYVDDYSNDYVPRSFKFVYDDSEDEEDEYYAYDNYHQPTTQAVLQESKSFEHEPMESSAESECSNSDFEESMEEEVLESYGIANLKAEISGATTSSIEKDEPNVSHQGSNDIVGHYDTIKELQKVLQIDDKKLEKLVQGGFGDDQILDAEFDKLHQANEGQAHAENFGGDESTTMESQSGLISTCVPCEVEFNFLLEPKPPSKFLDKMTFNGGKVNSNIGYGQMNYMPKFDRMASLNEASEWVFIHYFEEPPDSLSNVKIDLYSRVILTRFLMESWEDWKGRTRVICYHLRMICKIVKPNENILQNEYDWKDIDNQMTSSHFVKIVWEHEPD